VGPAGRLLDRALVDADVDRRLVYVTNAVKHFNWEPRGKRRLHKTPAQQELAACYQWLEAEIAAVRPKLIICLRATAAKVLFGSAVRITKTRGVERRPNYDLVATYHPSYLLRLKDEGDSIIQPNQNLPTARSFIPPPLHPSHFLSLISFHFFNNSITISIT
jgi:DNA polymerase